MSKYSNRVWIEPVADGFKFCTNGILRPGTVNRSLRTWRTKRAAIRAALREFGRCDGVVS